MKGSVGWAKAERNPPSLFLSISPSPVGDEAVVIPKFNIHVLNLSMDITLDAFFMYLFRKPYRLCRNFAYINPSFIMS